MYKQNQEWCLVVSVSVCIMPAISDLGVLVS
jgi:hypothetical protein